MKKTIFISTLLFLNFILLNPVSAQPERGPGRELPPAAKNALQDRQQVTTQDQGEEDMLVSDEILQNDLDETQLNEEAIDNQVHGRDAALLKARSKIMTVNQGARVVREKNNEVANQVLQLLMEKFESGEEGGIGEQVREIAQNQMRGQEEIENKLSRLEKRSVWLRFFAGQKEEEVEEVKGSLEENEERLEELQILLEDDSLSVEDQLALEEAYLELKAQQELMKAHLSNILGEFNVVGFFKRMFNRS